MRIENRMQSFDKELQDMGLRTRHAMAKAMEAFMKDDKELALAVVEGDDFINYADESINDQAIEILTLMQPVAKDLRMLIGGIKIANDLERIGDYAKNIGRFVIKSKTVDPRFREEIVNLTNIFLNNFDEVLDVMEKRNVKEAYRVASLDDDLDMEFKAFTHLLADNAEKNDGFPFELTTIARNIERAGDHSKNICEQIIYIVKGQHIDFG
ncbi:phosphate signaling complex protein PhoU [Erysipelothrix urinaevulpis]|uniref:phosphate signaling complex protein PhoU n=1 Tax=Erysipelothrix urinaevulpis TaxID=2683717 RepID=UPI001357BB5A